MAERVVPVQQVLNRSEAQMNGLIGRAPIKVGSKIIEIDFTKDFPLTDGWSVFKGEVIKLRRKRGNFSGRDGTEAGVGDGRNLLYAGVTRETLERGIHVTGVDIDPWRAVLAYQNLLSAGVPDNQLSIMVGGVVNELVARDPDTLYQGWNFACLPQAPGAETISTADGIDATRDTLDGGRDLALGPLSVDQYGLSLNAAYLEALRNRVTEVGTDVQVTLSGRVPTLVRNRLFRQTGWQIKEIFRTRLPVRQDVDTGVAFVGQFAAELDSQRGEGFFESPDGEHFFPLDPYIAEERRQIAENHGTLPDVHHHVYEYLAVPATESTTREPIIVYEI
ncbi:MAG TPA: hypothetical protein VNW29_01300 [Candidatus Sulfotelmatobacter sp.]|jgi:hypothetical protein|nr:hypothetical protein [Candidatus Sulfotelmatobacter sp.]